MPDFGDAVGIRFVEAMSGHVGPGGGVPGSGEAGWFSFDLDVRIPRLRAFLDQEPYEAGIAGGDISWKPFVPAASVRPGRLVMYRAEDDRRKRKFFDFEFVFPSGVGYDIAAEGHKVLHDDSGFDAASDLSSVFLTLHAHGSPIAKGVVSVHPAEFLRQLKSLEVTGAASHEEEHEAKEAFFAFMNRELREVYPGMPLILRDESRLTQEERRTLEILIRVMLPDPLPSDGPQVLDILKSLEEFLKRASSPDLKNARSWIHAAGLILSTDKRKIAEARRFVAAELKRSERSFVRDILGFCHTLVVLPYYSNAKTDARIGYRRPDHEPQGRAALRVRKTLPQQEFDVAIAGSGPAGSLLAARLAEAGKSVVLLEAGPYIRERDISTDELASIAQLYKESGFQRANEPRSIFDSPSPSFFVLQGACVGGGGVMNNAVCFRLPEHRLQSWQSAGFPFSKDDLDAAYVRVANDLSIVAASEAVEKAAHLNPAGGILETGLGTAGRPSVGDWPRPGYYECLLNLERFDAADGRGCLGLGLCNVGCGSERKQNALEVYLPRAVKSGCSVVQNARVKRIELAPRRSGQARRATGLEVVGGDGKERTIRAREFVLSCGAIGSSEVLLRSPDIEGHARSQGIPIGKRFCANLGSPMFAFANRKMHARPSLQITHYYLPEDSNAGYVLETWYNPPGANAAAMPGYLAEHFKRMRLYDRTVGAAPLVGTRPEGRISIGARSRGHAGGGLRVDLSVGEFEINRLAAGLSKLAEAFLASDAIDHVLAGFERGRELRNSGDVQAFRSELEQAGRDPARLHLFKLGTGHPQGGNALSENPLIGVVDSDFRVRGISNLRVADGSVFPDSAGVNPQWTIMALADLCARRMLGQA